MDKKVTLELFGKRLKSLRELHNLTTKALGEIVGVSDATISRYETGKRDPDLIIAYKIAEYFGVTVEYLCGETIDVSTESLISMYSRLSEETKKEAIKYITYLYEREV